MAGLPATQRVAVVAGRSGYQFQFTAANVGSALRNRHSAVVFELAFFDAAQAGNQLGKASETVLIIAEADVGDRVARANADAALAQGLRTAGIVSEQGTEIDALQTFAADNAGVAAGLANANNQIVAIGAKADGNTVEINKNKVDIARVAAAATGAKMPTVPAAVRAVVIADYTLVAADIGTIVPVRYGNIRRLRLTIGAGVGAEGDRIWVGWSSDQSDPSLVFAVTDGTQEDGAARQIRDMGNFADEGIGGLHFQLLPTGQFGFAGDDQHTGTFTLVREADRWAMYGGFWQ